MSKRKFKVGDRVIVNNKDKCYQGMAKVGDVGTVIKVDSHPNQPYSVKFDVKRFGYHGCDGECKNGYGYYCTERMLDLVSHKNESIVIYRKGQEVIALDKTTGKKAVAKCCPDDEFDFNVGAKLAFERLLGAEQPKKNITFRMLCIKDWDDYAKRGDVFVFFDGKTKFRTKTSCIYENFDDFMNRNKEVKDCFIELKDGDDPQEIMKQYDGFCHEFKAGKTYVFRKAIFKNDSNNRANGWDNECNGHVVKVSIKRNGIIKGYVIKPEWCEEIDLSIGDMVEVVDAGETYSTFDVWKGLKGYKQNYVNYKGPKTNKKYKCLNIDIHGGYDGTKLVALIQDTDTTQVFIIGLDGIKKA